MLSKWSTTEPHTLTQVKIQKIPVGSRVLKLWRNTGD